MKIQKHSKKGLKTIISIVIDKKSIQEKLDERLKQIQSEVSLKGFRPGKVPPSVIKSQFGKAIYGEVIDILLKESSTKAIQEKKIKVAGQPKIDLKSFGEGKDLNYELQVDSFPEINLKSLENFKAIQYKVIIEKDLIDKKIKELAEQNKIFENKSENEKAQIGDQVIFDYSATVDEKKFEGSEGKGVQIELGKDLFLKGFDNQLVGVKRGELKKVVVNLPANHPKKELSNKETNFQCKVNFIKRPTKSKTDDEFAKRLGVKNLNDLKKLIEDQISSQYHQSLNMITKKEILDQLEKNHEIEIPENLLNNEIKHMTQNQNKQDQEKHKKNNEKIARSRIKLGLIMNEYGEKNKIKVEDSEIKNEIQKQVKTMPGQEKMIFEYYQKNPNATQSLKSGLYEEKIINFIKSKIKLNNKSINTKEAEKIISDINKPKIPKKEQKSKTEKSSSKK